MHCVHRSQKYCLWPLSLSLFCGSLNVKFNFGSSSGAKVWKLIRRRNNIILYSQRTSDRFYSTGSPQKVTCHRFRRTDIQLVSMLAKRFQDSCRFGDISQPGRSTVYIDIIDIFGFHTCIFKSQLHHFIRPRPDPERSYDKRRSFRHPLQSLHRYVHLWPQHVHTLQESGQLHLHRITKPSRSASKGREAVFRVIVAG